MVGPIQGRLRSSWSVTSATYVGFLKAVFRGDALVVAGVHDHRHLRNDKLLDAMGLDIHGHDPQAAD